MSPRVSLLILLVITQVSSKAFPRRGGGSSSRGGGGGGFGGGHRSYGGGNGGHTYPSSPGLSGSGSGTGRTSGSATYPTSTGLSGNNRATHGTTYQRTETHHHYYSPPQQINYGTGYHPVYHGSPPVYIYEYRNSGSRFDNLLTGLALYNLGRMSVQPHYDSHREYRGTTGEVCKLQISKSNGEYEETRIDCKLMSSFIWEAEEKEREQNRVVSKNTNTVVTTSSVNSSSNGVTTTTNTTVVEALEVKGPSLSVTPGMTCYMIRISKDTSVLKREVDCGLLQEYAYRSFNEAERVEPRFAISVIVTLILVSVLS